ncbi:unnamed protein product, partial [Amoebophrya sp. A120]
DRLVFLQDLAAFVRDRLRPVFLFADGSRSVLISSEAPSYTMLVSHIMLCLLKFL